MSASERKLDGYHVVDANRILEFNVTQRDVNKGKPSACECAIAVAIMRELGAKRVRVNATRAYVERNGKYVRYKVPRGLLEQIELFDSRGDMGTGVFQLVPFSESSRLGVRHRSDNPPGTNTYRALKKRDRPIYKQED